jgi:hypothetical protein
MNETAKPSNEGSGANRENYKEIKTQDVSIEEIEKSYDESGFDDVRLNICIHHTVNNIKDKSSMDQTGASDTDDATSSNSAVISDEDASMKFEDLIIGKDVIQFPLPKQTEKNKNKRQEAKQAEENNKSNDDGRETE